MSGSGGGGPTKGLHLPPSPSPARKDPSHEYHGLKGLVGLDRRGFMKWVPCHTLHGRGRGGLRISPSALLGERMGQRWWLHAAGPLLRPSLPLSHMATRQKNRDLTDPRPFAETGPGPSLDLSISMLPHPMTGSGSCGISSHPSLLKT